MISQTAGTLYVVSTPIGNLADITLRALEVLKSVDVIVCEDTRHSKILLDHYGIRAPLLSLFQFKEKQKTDRALEELLRGKNLALVSDAGTPGIQDPGFLLVRECVRRGIPVSPIPGPVALIGALCASGLPTDVFVFEGFMPFKAGPRGKKIDAWKGEKRTVIFYESPHRLLKTLADMLQRLGDVEIVLAREITKKFEEFKRARLSALVRDFEASAPRGEFVVLLNTKEQPS